VKKPGTSMLKVRLGFVFVPGLTLRSHTHSGRGACHNQDQN